MGIKNVVKKVGDKAGNKVAKLASLSSDQVEEIQLQREAYLLEEPKPDDDMALETTWRMMAASSVEIFNACLFQNCHMIQFHIHHISRHSVFL